MIWTIQLEMVYVLLRFSQTAVKTFNLNPYSKGQTLGSSDASSLLTSLKRCLHHNRPQSNHSLQASSKKSQERCWKSNNNQQEFSIHRDRRRRNQEWPRLSGLWPFLVSPPSQKLYWDGQIRLPTANSNFPAGIFHPFQTHGSQWLHKTKPQGFNTCSRLKSICKINFYTSRTIFLKELRFNPNPLQIYIIYNDSLYQGWAKNIGN